MRLCQCAGDAILGRDRTARLDWLHLGPVGSQSRGTGELVSENQVVEHRSREMGRGPGSSPTGIVPEQVVWFRTEIAPTRSDYEGSRQRHTRY